MERNRSKKHECKFCNKSFPSGRSLGGHMRSHAAATSSSDGAGEKLEKKRSLLGAVSGYDLRENPKKTWRVTDPIRKQNEASEKQGSVVSDDEAPGLVAAPTKRQRSKRCCVSEREEQEDAAFTLMMLSMDTGHRTGGEEPLAVSDEFEGNLQAKMETLDGKRSKFGGSSGRTKILERCGSRKIGSLDACAAETEEKRSRYECPDCKKSFHSYQALGGHRGGHRRFPGGCLRLRPNGMENNSLDTADSVDRTTRWLPEKAKENIVSISEGEESVDMQQQNTMMHELPDLQLGMHVSEDSEFRQWWKCEAVVAGI